MIKAQSNSWLHRFDMIHVIGMFPCLKISVKLHTILRFLHFSSIFGNFSMLLHNFSWITRDW